MRTSYRIFLYLILTLFAEPSLAAENHDEKAQTLVFLNWAEYIDPALLQAFEQSYHVTVRQVFYDSDAKRTEMLRATGARGFDVVLVGGADMPSYRQRGWLGKLTAQEVPNLVHSDLHWLDAYSGAPKDYGIPYLWGGTGILYRTDKIQQPITQWSQLFAPQAEWKGKIIMLNDEREMIGNALKSLGYSYNSNKPDALRAAEQLLLAQKPFVAGYATTLLSEKSGFITGDYWIGMVFNGDALALKDLDPQLEFVIPEEGIGLWCDYLTVPAAAEHKTLAYQLIDFLNRPESAAKLAEFTLFATTNQAAEALLSEDFLANPMIYPPKKIRQKSEQAAQHPPRALRARALIYAKVAQ